MAVARSVARASGRPRNAVDRRSSPSTTAWAPAGRAQSPPSSARKARSASTHRRVGSCSMRGEHRAQLVVVLAALDGQRALADLRQHHVDGAAARRCASARPSRSSAAAATTMASCSAALASRVLHVARAARRSGGPGRWRRSCGPPAQRPGGHLGALGQVGERRARPARRGDRPARARRRATRPGTRDRRAGPWRECTARSARPSSTAACTSLANTPLPPISQIGTSRRRSPWVSTTTSSTVERRDRRAREQRRDVLGLPARQRAPARRRPERAHRARSERRRRRRGRRGRAAPRRAARRGPSRPRP